MAKAANSLARHSRLGLNDCVNLTRFMSELLQYLTGEEVHAGDRVQYNGTYGTVVFVSDGTNEEYSPGYEDYIGTDRGIMICDDDGGSTFITEPDGMLSFIDRG